MSFLLAVVSQWCWWTHWFWKFCKKEKLLIAFSELELTFTFAICHRPSVCRLSLCNVRAHYLGDWNYRQCFYAIWYLGHPWPFGKNFKEIVTGQPRDALEKKPTSHWGNYTPSGVKRKRGSQNVAILDLSKAISRKRYKMLILIKSHNFRLVPKSVTLNDRERRIVALTSPNRSVRDGLRKCGWRYTNTFCSGNVDQRM